MSKINFSELNISYKLNRRFSFGVSMMRNLGNCSTTFTTAEGQVFKFDGDDDDEYDEYDDDDDHDEYDDDDDDDCGEDEFGNLMATVKYTVSDKFPVFVEAAVGYSLNNSVPVYTTLVGYNQKIVAGVGIVVGVRYSDILYKMPIDAVSMSSSHGFKAELGLTWNF